MDFPKIQPTLSDRTPSSGGVREKESPFSNVSGADLSNAVLDVCYGCLRGKLQPFKDTKKNGKNRKIHTGLTRILCSSADFLYKDK